MKKTAVIFLIFASLLSAQKVTNGDKKSSPKNTVKSEINLGLSIFGGISQIVNEYGVAGTVSDVTFSETFAYSLGGFANYTVPNSQFALQGELRLSKTGGTANSDNYDGSYSIYSIDIPVMVQLDGSSMNLPGKVLLGVDVNYFLTQSHDPESVNEIPDGILKDWNYSLLAGLEVPLGRLALNVRYMQGLADIFIGDGEWKTLSIMFGISYRTMTLD